MKRTLTKAQAARLAPIWAQKQRADEAWQAALDLLDVNPAQLAGGELAGETPYLVLATESRSEA